MLLAAMVEQNFSHLTSHILNGQKDIKKHGNWSFTINVSFKVSAVLSLERKEYLGFVGLEAFTVWGGSLLQKCISSNKLVFRTRKGIRSYKFIKASTYYVKKPRS